MQDQAWVITCPDCGATMKPVEVKVQNTDTKRCYCRHCDFIISPNDPGWHDVPHDDITSDGFYQPAIDVP